VFAIADILQEQRKRNAQADPELLEAGAAI
jgi:hypothetical protein